MLELRKVTLKLYDDNARDAAWIHFAYVDKNVFKIFTKERVAAEKTIAWWIRKWVKDDFDLPIMSKNELNIAKDAIRNVFKAEYPEIYTAGITDRQGWTRLWLTKKMEDELKNG